MSKRLSDTRMVVMRARLTTVVHETAKIVRTLGVLLPIVASACGPTPGSSGAADRAGTADEQGDAGQVAAPTASPSWTVRAVSIEIERQPDGTRYVSFVRERYELEGSASLRYFAYFGGMPIEMNHTDGLDWDAGSSGRAVLDAVAEILADAGRRAELVPEPDDGPAPPYPGRCYRVGVRGAEGDSTFLVGENGGRAFRIVDAAFTDLIAEFERATGRPLTPSQLPQR